MNKHLRGKVYANMLCGEPIFVSNKNKHDRGISDLKNLLLGIASSRRIEHYPLRWLALAELINIRKRSNHFLDHNMLTFGEFKEFAAHFLKDDEDAHHFLERHHAFGDLLYYSFKDGSRRIIIDPQLLINTISPVLIPKLFAKRWRLRNRSLLETLQKDGILYDALLRECWGEKCGSFDRCSETIELMTRVDMIVAIPVKERSHEARYMVPCLLPSITKAKMLPESPVVAPPLYFKFYKYERLPQPYLPHGLFPRLMSRCLSTCAEEAPAKFLWFEGENPACEYVYFIVQHNSESLAFALHNIDHAIKLTAHQLAPYKVEGQNRQNIILSRIKKTVQGHLLDIVRTLFPNLEPQMRLCIKCGCNKPRQKPRDHEVWMDGAALYSSITMLCTEHHHRFSTVPYRLWFPRKKSNRPMERHASIDLMDSILPIEVQKVCDQEAKRILSDPAVYPMTNESRGFALIINNREFKVKALSNRDGSDLDEFNLTNLFEQLGFKVRTERDRTANEMKEIVKKEASSEEHGKANAFVMCILSHGKEGLVAGTDGVYVNIEYDIKLPFTQEPCRLPGKPKVFLIQTCQGIESTEGMPTGGGASSSVSLDRSSVSLEASSRNSSSSDGEYTSSESTTNFHIGRSVPDSPTAHPAGDILVVFPNAPRYQSYRLPDKGTVFIRSFVYMVGQFAHVKHLKEILDDHVKPLLEDYVTDPHIAGSSYKQVLQINDTGFKKLYFLPGYYNKDADRDEYQLWGEIE